MKKNLFKKVAALVTATSMIASLGTVAFAENYSGTGINITNVNAQKAVNNDGAVVDGVYDVTVSYEVAGDVTNAIGVTMLAYAGKNLSVDASDYTKYDTSMQIVGIDQQEQTAQTGTFEFRVTTKGDAADAIKVTYDVPSIILVSGDNVTPAAATLLITTPREEKTAASVGYTYEGDTIPYYSYEKADLKDNVKAALADMSDTATLKDVAGNVIGTVLISDVNIISAVKNDNSDTCKVTATIPDGTTVTSDLYDVTIPDGLNVEFDVDVVLVPWAVVSAGYKDGTMTIKPPTGADDVETAIVTAIGDKLKKDGVTLKGEVKEAVKTLKGDALDVTVDLAEDADYNPDNTDDQELESTVTVNFTDEEAVVPAGTVLTFALTVTVSATPAGTYGDLNGDDKINAADVAQLWKKVKNSSYVFHDKYDNSVIDDTYAKLNTDDKINAADVAQLWKKIKDSTYVFPVEAE